jgi:prophage regulatory protein
MPEESQPPKLQPPELDSYIREKQLLEIIPISSNALAAQIAKGTFPAPVKLGPRSVAWNLRSVREWLQDRVADSEVKQRERAERETERARRAERETAPRRPRDRDGHRNT